MITQIIDNGNTVQLVSDLFTNPPSQELIEDEKSAGIGINYIQSSDLIEWYRPSGESPIIIKQEFVTVPASTSTLDLFNKLVSILNDIPGLNPVLIADNYTDLVASFPPANNAGKLGHAETPQGTQWLPGSMGGDYYGKGLYFCDGVDWLDDSDLIYNAIEQLNIAVNSRVDNVISGDGINVDNTDPNNPIVNAIPKEHRHIYFAADNATPTVISAANTPVKILGTTTNGFGTSGLTMTANNRIENTSGGTLRVEISGIVSGNKDEGAGSDDYIFYIAQTGAVLIGSKNRDRMANTQDGSAYPSWVGDLSNGQYVEVFVSNSEADSDVLILDLSLIVKEL